MAKKLFTPQIKSSLKKIYEDAMANAGYQRAIKTFEKYRKTSDLDNDLRYYLGTLYDHQAQWMRRKKTNSHKDDFSRYFKLEDKKISECEKRAFILYRGILKRDPKYYWAFQGISRVLHSKGQFKKALAYALKAYRLQRKTGDKGSLGIGLLFEQLKNFKKAEYWWLKELHDKGRKNFSANLNLLFFYNRQCRYKEAVKYANIIRSLFKEKPSDFRNSQWGQTIQGEIKKARLNWCNKRSAQR